MRLHRFYITKPLGEEIVNVDNQVLIHQLYSVFRYQPSDEVVLFSGDGYDYHYTISSISKKEIYFVLKEKTVSIQPGKEITLYMSLVKKDTFEHIVRAGTELGVTRFVPILADRSEKKNINEERLILIAQEASEQCGRGDIPLLSPIMTLEEAISSLSHTENALTATLFGNVSTDTSLKKILTQKEISLFVGPEGGWSPREEMLFQEKGVCRIRLTDTVLKADTGAIALITLTALS